jgi:DNA polymerase-3 subunit gamma/tau
MTSQVYYRKWRPSSFSDLVGQDHIATTLKQAIKQDRVSHAYLFSGLRGTGKTSTARILAKVVNCLDPQDGNPCNECRVCQSCNEGRFLDIIEIDAASNGRVEGVRDIRDKVNFSPVEGRRKVYIVDEAHMLTTEASNAFLKTLEEPPAHVMFILCTTNANKILPTIISRCQRFDFRRLPLDSIYKRLLEITRAEGVNVTPEAMRVVARCASGSLRDAENILEQLVVSYGDGVGLGQVEELLGLGYGERWLELVKYLLMGNTTASLAVINQAAWDGTDLRQLHRQTLELLRAVMLLHWNSGDFLDYSEDISGELRGLIGKLPGWRISTALKLWSEANMRVDAPSTLPLELAVVEICNIEIASSTNGNLASPDMPSARDMATAHVTVVPHSVAPPAKPAPAKINPESRERPAYAAEGPSQTPSSPPDDLIAPLIRPNTVGDEIDLRSRWLAAVKLLDRYNGKKFKLGALLRDCKSEGLLLDGDILVLPFKNRSNMERMQQEMDDPEGRKRVRDTVKEYFGASDFRLTLFKANSDSGGSTSPAKSSPLVRAAQHMGARLVEEIEE